MNENNETGKNIDTIFNNDPIYMLSLIGKKVQVELDGNEMYSGIVYVIDPIFKSLIIHERDPSDSHFVTRLILYHAIKSLTILSNVEIENYGEELESLKVEENTEAIKKRKSLLKDWFQHMRLHIEESGDYLKIDDNVVIVPPYGPKNCICNNTLILERIQNIITSMPSTN